MLLNLLKEFRVKETPNKTDKLVSDSNKNILVNEIIQYFSMPIP